MIVPKGPLNLGSIWNDLESSVLASLGRALAKSASDPGTQGLLRNLGS